jgi:PhnB protein
VSSPENPRPAFVLELARRIEQELAAEQAQVNAVVPCLVVPDIDTALGFYEDAFGARAVRRHHLPDGVLVYAEFRLGSTRLGVADEDPATRPGRHLNRSPRTLGGSPVPIDLAVDDTDVFVDRAVAAGAEIVIPVGDRSHGRSGRLVDPFGHLWIVSSPLPAVR